MKFEEAYNNFIIKHTKGIQDERLKRLKEGLGHAEKLLMETVWWPAFGNFDNLHPEFEISDFKDGLRFIDFAFFIYVFRIAIEVDGLSTHVQNISDWQHSDHNARQNHLIIDGWLVIRFTYKDVKELPRMCIQTIQQLIGKLSGTQIIQHDQISIEEKGILLLSLRLDRKLIPNDVCILLNVKRQKALKMLHILLEKQLLISGGEGGKRINCYKPHPNLSALSLGL